MSSLMGCCWVVGQRRTGFRCKPSKPDEQNFEWDVKYLEKGKGRIH